MGRECELKLTLTEDGLARLHRLLAPAARLVLQRNHYLDTAAGDLRRSKHGLRLRLEVPLPPAWLDPPEGVAQRILRPVPPWADAPGEPLLLPRQVSDPERYVLSLKGPSVRLGEWVDRQDDQAEISHPEAEGILARGSAARDLPLPSLALFVGALPDDHVRVLGASDNLRRIYAVDLRDPAGSGAAQPQPPYRLEVDSTRYPGGAIKHEAELELPHGAGSPVAGEVRAALQALFARAGVPWTPGERGKFSRFLARAGLAERLKG